MATPAPVVNPDIKYTQLFIGNAFVDSVSGKTFATYNPATGEKLADLQEGDQADVDKAVAAAKAAFKRGSEWRNYDATKRATLLHKFADLIERDRTLLATLEVLDNGKTYKAAYNGDLPSAIRRIRYFAGLTDKIVGQTIPVDGNFFAYTRLEPVGVCGAITPWDYPICMFVQKVAPALTAGNVVVMKPAEQTTITALYLAALVKEAGFPAGVVNVVPGYGPTAGAAIANHPDVNKVSFTGSTEVGKLIMQASGKTNLKHVTLELGGKSPNIIFPDFNMEYAVEVAHQAIMSNMGQICCAGSRTYVHADIYDEFVRRSVERAKKRTVGDPFDDSNENGAQIDGTQMKKILELIQSGSKEGARLLCGGKRKGDNGYFVEPTVFADVTESMQIGKEEIFGPVQSIFKFSTTEEVIERANDTFYGLAAAVFTQDIDTALTVANALEAGTVWVNTFGQFQSSTPFGGYKMSGVGREFGFPYGLQEYCQVKTIYIKTQTK